LLLAVALVVGCGANLAPVLDVQNAPVVTPQGVAPNNQLVRDAIVRALANRTWSVVEERPNEIVARVSAGGHDATALVKYDERSYSITRVDSSPGLKYDGTYIHRRYNHWIDRLRASIQQELSTAQPGAAPAAEPAAPAAASTTPAPDAAPAATGTAAADDVPPAPPPAQP
jgi:hypothetical protein